MADTWIAFYGLKLELSEDEEVTDPKHPLTSKVSKHGLEWDTFYYPDAADPGQFNVVLMIGRNIGEFGQDGLQALDFDENDLMALAQEVRANLVKAKIPGSPRLWLVFQPEDF